MKNVFLGLDKDETNRYLNHTNTDLLRKGLKEYQKSLELLEVSIDYFDSPNWANKEAFVLGQKKAIAFMLKNLEIR